MLDDDDGGFGEFGDELPAGVEVDEVVVGELFTLELLRGGDAGGGSVGVEGGLLVRVFAVAEGGGLRVDEAERSRQGGSKSLRFAAG